MRALRLTVVTLLALALPLRARAQIVRDQPLPASVSGKVTLADGRPVPDAEISIGGATIRIRSNGDGTFVFPSIAPGARMLGVRKVGFLPAVANILVKANATTTVDVELVPAPAQLDTVLVEAKVKILAGVVTDSSGYPLAGAIVDLVGAGHATTTSGPDGWFSFTNLRPGPLVVKGRKPGYEMGVVSLRFEDTRGIVLHLNLLDSLHTSATRLAELSGSSNFVEAAWADAQQRIVSRGGRAAVLSRQDLEPFDDLPLGQAVMRSPSSAMLALDLQVVNSMACVLLDGRRIVGNLTLDSYDTSEVEMVELYPPGSESSGTIARYLRGAGCRPVQTTGSRRGPFYAVVWMR